MSRCHGIAGELRDASALLAAARSLRDAGYTWLDAYAPYPIDGLGAAIGARRSRLPLWMLAGALVGGLGLFAIETWSVLVAYPIHVGGRPLWSWPAFLPAALEMTLLGAAVAGVVAMLKGADLPRLHHPMFALDRFEAASRDGYFIVVRADDPAFDAGRVRRDLAAAGARDIVEMGE